MADKGQNAEVEAAYRKKRIDDLQGLIKRHEATLNDEEQIDALGSAFAENLKIQIAEAREELGRYGAKVPESSSGETEPVPDWMVEKLPLAREALGHEGKLTVTLVKARCKVGNKRAKDIIQKLVDEGLIEQEGRIYVPKKEKAPTPDASDVDKEPQAENLAQFKADQAQQTEAFRSAMEEADIKGAKKLLSRQERALSNFEAAFADSAHRLRNQYSEDQLVILIEHIEDRITFAKDYIEGLESFNELAEEIDSTYEQVRSEFSDADLELKKKILEEQKDVQGQLRAAKADPSSEMARNLEEDGLDYYLEKIDAFIERAEARIAAEEGSSAEDTETSDEKEDRDYWGRMLDEVLTKTYPEWFATVESEEDLRRVRQDLQEAIRQTQNQEGVYGNLDRAQRQRMIKEVQALLDANKDRTFAADSSKDADEPVLDSVGDIHAMMNDLELPRETFRSGFVNLFTREVTYATEDFVNGNEEERRQVVEKMGRYVQEAKDALEKKRAGEDVPDFYSRNSVEELEEILRVRESALEKFKAALAGRYSAPDVDTDVGASEFREGFVRWLDRQMQLEREEFGEATDKRAHIDGLKQTLERSRADLATRRGGAAPEGPLNRNSAEEIEEVIRRQEALIAEFEASLVSEEESSRLEEERKFGELLAEREASARGDFESADSRRAKVQVVKGLLLDRTRFDLALKDDSHELNDDFTKEQLQRLKAATNELFQELKGAIPDTDEPVPAPVESKDVDVAGEVTEVMHGLRERFETAHKDDKPRVLETMKEDLRDLNAAISDRSHALNNEFSREMLIALHDALGPLIDELEAKISPESEAEPVRDSAKEAIKARLDGYRERLSKIKTFAEPQSLEVLVELADDDIELYEAATRDAAHLLRQSFTVAELKYMAGATRAFLKELERKGQLEAISPASEREAVRQLDESAAQARAVQLSGGYLSRLWRKHVKGELLPEEQEGPEGTLGAAGIAKAIGIGAVSAGATYFGVKSFVDVPRYMTQKMFTKWEKDELKKLAVDVPPQENELKVSAGMDLRVEMVRRRIEKSNYLTAEKKQELFNRLKDVIDQREQDIQASVEIRNREAAKIIDDFIETRVSGATAVKESVNTAMAMTGLHGLRAGVYGLVALEQRRQRIAKEMRLDDSDRSFTKRFFVDGFNETWGNIRGREGETRLQRAANLAKASGNIMRAVGLSSLAIEYGPDFFDTVLDKLEGTEAAATGSIGGAVEGVAAVSAAETAEVPLESVVVTPEREPSFAGLVREIEATPDLREVIFDTSPEILERGTVQGGDGIVGIIARQMEADPAKFGFTGDADDVAAVNVWANARALDIARAEGIVDGSSEIRLADGAVGKMSVVVGEDGIRFVDANTGDKLSADQIKSMTYEHNYGRGPVASEVEVASTNPRILAEQAFGPEVTEVSTQNVGGIEISSSEFGNERSFDLQNGALEFRYDEAGNVADFNFRDIAANSERMEQVSEAFIESKATSSDQEMHARMMDEYLSVLGEFERAGLQGSPEYQYVLSDFRYYVELAAEDTRVDADADVFGNYLEGVRIPASGFAESTRVAEFAEAAASPRSPLEAPNALSADYAVAVQETPGLLEVVETPGTFEIGRLGNVHFEYNPDGSVQGWDPNIKYGLWAKAEMAGIVSEPNGPDLAAARREFERTGVIPDEGPQPRGQLRAKGEVARTLFEIKKTDEALERAGFNPQSPERTFMRQELKRVERAFNDTWEGRMQLTPKNPKYRSLLL